MRRNNLENVKILGDRAYDCEDLHQSVVDKGGRLYAPVRKTNKRSLRRFPKGRYRKSCLELPDFMGKRGIVEAVNGSLKRRFLISLRSKIGFMKKREFAWTIVVYNLDRELICEDNEERREISFFILLIIF